eukprot:5815534-Amphidinium_carterae.2
MPYGGNAKHARDDLHFQKPPFGTNSNTLSEQSSSDGLREPVACSLCQPYVKAYDLFDQQSVLHLATTM